MAESTAAATSAAPTAVAAAVTAAAAAATVQPARVAVNNGESQGAATGVYPALVDVNGLSKEEKEGVEVYNYVKSHELLPALMAALQQCGSAEVMAELTPQLKKIGNALQMRGSSEEEWQSFLAMCGIREDMVITKADDGARKRKRGRPERVKLNLASVKAFFEREDVQLVKVYGEYKLRMDNARDGLSRLRPFGLCEQEWRMAAVQREYLAARDRLGKLVMRMIMAEATAAGCVPPASAPSFHESLSRVQPSFHDRDRNHTRPGPKIGGQPKKRTKLPPETQKTLKGWLFAHFEHPYPTDKDKLALMRETGVTREQLANWFINSRTRIWKPVMLRLKDARRQGHTAIVNKHGEVTITSYAPSMAGEVAMAAAAAAAELSSTTKRQRTAPPAAAAPTAAPAAAASIVINVAPTVPAVSAETTTPTEADDSGAMGDNTVDL